ncbi:MAG TPA: hypothetical protein VGR93_12480 [Candidatus Acidoferrales bacterium]|nr:hypothetical protein [Candidatus Acidoferrales bacterium]
MRILPSSLVIFSCALLFSAPVFAQTIPPNTDIMIILDQAISSKNAKHNQRVKASVAKDVVVDGDVLLPKGAPAAVYVAKAQPGGDSSKPAVLVLRLDAITVGGRAYPVSAHYAGEPPQPENDTPTNAGVAGATGTPVKAKATDRRTAASGGAAAGNENADSISSQGIADVYYPSNTVLSFRLKAPVQVK